LQPVPAPLPPFDRESFLDAQRRNRLATWRLTAVAYLAVLIVCFAISVLLSPVLIGALVLLVDLLAIVLPVPDLGAFFWQFLDRLTDDSVRVSAGELVRGIALASAPGLMLALLAWAGLRRLFARFGPDAVVSAIGARDLDPQDFEQRQLGNAVEEMAIAANIRPPRITLYAGSTINGAAIGRGTEDAVLVVSRAALDELNRAQTQALCGHLIATVANGDVRPGGLIISVLQLCGLTRVLTIALFERHAREMMRRLLRRDSGDGLQLMSELVAYATMEEKVRDDTPKPSADTSNKLSLVDWLRMPFMAPQLIGGIMLPMLTSFLLLPLFALSWRARRYLADATAVQLTRDPESLSEALAKLGRTGVGAPGPAWVQHLFFASGRTGAIVSFHPTFQKRVNYLRRLGASLHFVPPRPTPKELAIAVFVVGPLLVLMAALMGTALFLMGVLNFMLSMLFLLPVIALLHFLLRKFV
jgi:Zn-dependent protease with chaperone function